MYQICLLVVLWRTLLGVVSDLQVACTHDIDIEEVMGMFSAIQANLHETLPLHIIQNQSQKE